MVEDRNNFIAALNKKITANTNLIILLSKKRFDCIHLIIFNRK